MSVLAENVVVDGRYRVLSRVGAGGMAEVWCAEDTQLGRKVALKVLHRNFAQDHEFVERFRREASAAAGLQHPNVVGVFDRGEYDGTYYIAMEYVDGESLRDVINRGVGIPRAVDLTRQILAAASFAHARGIVHRDLKPLNVLVDHDGRARVADFGIARAGASEITEAGSVVGTAQYLSPEQAQGLEVTPASDVYSIGVILYELLTGRVPFTGDSPVAVAMMQVSQPPIPPRRLNPAVSPALEAVVLRALAKDPRNRFATAQEFSAALDRAEATPHRPLTDTAAAAPPPSERGTPWRWILLAVLAGILAALAVWALTRPDQVLVPSVLNRDEDRARAILEREGFDVRIDAEPSQRPEGEVFEQDPPPGSEADEGSIVTIVVSTGPGSAQVPAVANRTVAEARRRLERAGFTVEVRRVFSDSVPSGRVIRTEPRAGVTLERGQTVTLVVSKGADVVTLPTVVGLDRIVAERTLEELGLVVNVETQNADEPEGEVILQIPGPQSEVSRGDEVTIVVSTGAGSIRVRDVVGQTENAAKRMLENQNLEVRVRRVDVDDPVDDGRVVDQSPSGGSRAVSGERVTIFIGRFNEPPPEEGEEVPAPRGPPASTAPPRVGR